MELSENTKKIVMIILVAFILIVSLIGVFVPDSRVYIKEVVGSILNFIPVVMK